MPKINWEGIDPDVRKKMLAQMSPEDAALFAEPEPRPPFDYQKVFEETLAELQQIKAPPLITYTLPPRKEYKRPIDWGFWNNLARVFVFFMMLIIILAEISSARNRL